MTKIKEISVSDLWVEQGEKSVIGHFFKNHLIQLMSSIVTLNKTVLVFFELSVLFQ